MAPHILVNAPLAAVMVVGLALTNPVAFAQGKGGGKGGGGHTTATTNLSYPAVFTSTAPSLNGTEGEWTLQGDLGVTWSYGCAKADQEFPNTSCVKDDGTVMTYDECKAECGTLPLDRIYWQRLNPTVVWQAESLTTGDSGQSKWAATHIDWGDNLESQTWSATSVIRVETTPFATLPGSPPPETQLGFEMWHVTGKGQTELWGVRATDEDVPEPYTDTSPYAIVHAPNALLSFTKLAKDGETCPTAENFYPSPYDNLQWDKDRQKWLDGSTYLCRLEPVVAYTVELNIGGKFVHGHNWQVSSVPERLCQSADEYYVKEGWWRLTYYGVDDAVDFFTFPEDPGNMKPPVIPEVAEIPVPQLADPQPAGREFVFPQFRLRAIEAEADTGPLYTPVVDRVNNLTYIDICLTAGKRGGKRR